jgi:hypothetical protein
MGKEKDFRSETGLKDGIDLGAGKKPASNELSDSSQSSMLGASNAWNAVDKNKKANSLQKRESSESTTDGKVTKEMRDFNQKAMRLELDRTVTTAGILATEHVGSWQIPGLYDDGELGTEASKFRALIHELHMMASQCIRARYWLNNGDATMAKSYIGDGPAEDTYKTSSAIAYLLKAQALDAAESAPYAEIINRLSNGDATAVSITGVAGALYFEAPDRKIENSQFVNPLKCKPKPIGYCTAGSMTLGAITVGSLHCSTNNKSYYSAGFTSAMGIAVSKQVLSVWGIEGASIDDVITGPSGGVEASLGEGVFVGTTVVQNRYGIVGGVGGGIGFSIPAGLNFSETYESGSGKVPLVSSTYEAVYNGVTELSFGGSGRGKIYNTLVEWPVDQKHGLGLFRYLTGQADSNLHDFTNKLPAPLEKKWMNSSERKEIFDLVADAGGEAAVSNSHKWDKLVPQMKERALLFWQREVKDYVVH